MVNPEKSRKKGGVQVCVLFPFHIYDEIFLIMKKQKDWFKEADFIREAVKEKIEKWKIENPEKG